MSPSCALRAVLWGAPVALCMMADIDGMLATRDPSRAGYWWCSYIMAGPYPGMPQPRGRIDSGCNAQGIQSRNIQSPLPQHPRP